MKWLQVILLLFVSLFVFSFTFPISKKIQGHWISKGCISFSSSGDTILFEKKKYDRTLYVWGGGAYSGVEFNSDNTFVEHFNVSCSDESDDAKFHGEYHFKSDSIVEVKGDKRSFRFKVLTLNSKKMSIKILK